MKQDIRTTNTYNPNEYWYVLLLRGPAISLTQALLVFIFFTLIQIDRHILLIDD